MEELMEEPMEADDTDVQTRLQAFFGRRNESGSARVVAYDPITGGYSRETARVWVEDSTGIHGYVVRSDPASGNSVLQTDRTEEWALLCALGKDGSVPVPAPLWFDADGSELGTRAIVMELIDGPSLLSVVRDEDPAQQLQLALPIADVVAAIHRFDVAALPAHLPVPASWDDYIDTCVRRWREAEQVHVERDPVFRLIACWLEANKPAPVPLGLVHGDFHPANLIVDPDGCYQVVDWEVAHVGDPREDLGWMALAAIAQPPDVIAADPAAFYERYRRCSGLPAEALDPASIAYFVVLSATTTFLQVISRLRELADGETTAIKIAYITNIKAGLQRILFDAMTDPQLVTRVAP